MEHWGAGVEGGDLTGGSLVCRTDPQVHNWLEDSQNLAKPRLQFITVKGWR